MCCITIVHYFREVFYKNATITWRATRLAGNSAANLTSAVCFPFNTLAAAWMIAGLARREVSVGRENHGQFDLIGALSL